MKPIPRLRPWSGPQLLSYGFRPFFLFASLFAAISVGLWLPLFYGEARLPTAFAPVTWHIHEMIYGYLPAVIAGFLLTAIPNWTGRLPVQGIPLLGLVFVWLAGRIAIATSAFIGPLLAAAIDLSFLLILAAVAAREIIAGQNRGNLKVLLAVSLLWLGNLVFHIEANSNGGAEHGFRIGMAALVLLLMLIGGRIIPSFTRNWLVRENPGTLPVPFGRFDVGAVAVSAVGLLSWILAPGSLVAGSLLLLAGLLQAGRLGRWVGHRTWRDRLVLILHLAYAFIPIGFVLLGLASFGLVPESAGIHAWAVGGFGGMTLAVMSRASLGHTGRPLRASAGTQTVYGLILAAALARIAAALWPEHSGWLLPLAAGAWIAAFLGFAVIYWPALTQPRRAN